MLILIHVISGRNRPPESASQKAPNGTSEWGITQGERIADHRQRATNADGAGMGPAGINGVPRLPQVKALDQVCAAPRCEYHHGLHARFKPRRQRHWQSGGFALIFLRVA